MNMNVETFGKLCKLAAIAREKRSDFSMSYDDIEKRMVIDAAAERLILTCMVKRFRNNNYNNYNMN